VKDYPRNFYKTLIEDLRQAVFQADDRGQWTYLSPAWERVTGFSVEESLGKSVVQFLVPEDRALALSFYELMTDNKKDECSFQGRVQTRSGDNRWLKFDVRAHRDPAGKISRFSGAMDDITESKFREDGLSAQNHYIQAVLDAVPGHVSWFDQELRYRGVNQSLAQTCGREPAEFLGKPVGWLYSAAGGLRALLEALYQSGDDALTVETSFTIGDQEIPYLVSIRKFHDEDGKQGAVVVGIDLSKNKEVTQELQVQRARLVEASKLAALGQMAGGVAHEINNPLSVIQTYGNELQNLFARDGFSREKAVKYVDKIVQTCEKISKIVKGMRVFSRNGDHDPFERCSVNQVIADTLEICRGRFKTADVFLRLGTIDEGLEANCRIVQLGQVLMNLLSNAVDAVTGQEDAWVELKVEDQGGWILFSVTDSGKGIPWNIAEKIMQPFFTTKGVGKGTGLGLSIASSIIKGHGGLLWIDFASPNTCFRFRIPKQPAASSRSAA
jgi:PAS domain S-box-containing protein